MTVARVGHRYGGHELTGIGVLRVFKHRAARAYFDNATAIHHRHAVADALHHRHIMGNKQKRDAHLALQVEHQIDNLRPNGDIQADTDSSAITTFGFSASARAMQIRCRWPPEKAWG